MNFALSVPQCTTGPTPGGSTASPAGDAGCDRSKASSASGGARSARGCAVIAGSCLGADRRAALPDGAAAASARIACSCACTAGGGVPASPRVVSPFVFSKCAGSGGASLMLTHLFCSAMAKLLTELSKPSCQQTCS